MITVICPSRGRPDNAIRLVKSFSSTKRRPDTQLAVAIDASDPRFQDYWVIDWDDWVEDEHVNLFVASPERLRMVATLNKTSKKAVENTRCDVVGFVGDDHLFETDGWDTKVIEAMVPNGIVYGDDGHQHGNLPTAVFMDANIVRRLGWMAPPQFTHLWVDNVWKALGEKLGTLRYLPEMKIAHLHPNAGKASWDATYAEANAPEVDSADREKFYEWANGDGLRDAVKELKA